jgi:hypothetical protein
VDNEHAQFCCENLSSAYKRISYFPFLFSFFGLMLAKQAIKFDSVNILTLSIVKNEKVPIYHL